MSPYGYLSSEYSQFIKLNHFRNPINSFQYHRLRIYSLPIYITNSEKNASGLSIENNLIKEENKKEIKTVSELPKSTNYELQPISKVSTYKCVSHSWDDKFNNINQFLDKFRIHVVDCGERNRFRSLEEDKRKIPLDINKSKIMRNRKGVKISSIEKFVEEEKKGE